MPWPCSELTMISARADQVEQPPAFGERDRVSRRVAFLGRHVAPAPAMVESRSGISKIR